MGGVDTASAIATHLAHAPDVAADLAAAHAAAYAAVPAELLDICRLRIAQLLGCEWELDQPDVVADLAGWPTSVRFGPAERACLALTEQWLIDVASVTDEQIGDVREHLGEPLTVNFANALLVVEQRQRLALAWHQLFGGTP